MKKWYLVFAISLLLTNSHFTVIASNTNPTENQEKTELHQLQELISQNIAAKLIAYKEQNELLSHIETLNIAKQFKAIAASGGWDPNIAFIFDNQNPDITYTYRNDKGEIKTKKYRASINSIGLKAELEFKYNIVFVTGETNFNFHDSNKVIELGSGIDIKTNTFDLTYVTFKHMAGGLIILGIPVTSWLLAGPTMGFILLNMGISYVTGGYLYPIM